MSELVKLKMIGYETEDYPEGKKSGEFVTQINPVSLKLGKKLNYQEGGEAQGTANLRKFRSQGLDSLSFEIILDDTGIVASKNGKIKDRINQIEKSLYRINSESHEPSYAKVVWGTLIFKGRIESLSYDYTLFAPDGTPLRVKVSLSFFGYFDKDVTQKNSPDLSRVIVFRAGDTIARYCDEIYGDASFCEEIARFNSLGEFRFTPPGTKVMFPPLAPR
jgi:hypothetical protein